MIPRYITGPLIGALIGCITNYIAVKMLFYPRKEIRVFGHVLPFTPGAIPKGKARLADAIGNVVASSLLTKKDIEEMVLSEKIEGEVASAMMKHLTVNLKDEICSLTGAGEEKYNEKKKALSEIISKSIVESIDVVSLMENYGAQYMKDKIYSHKLGQLISEELIDSMAVSLGRDLEDTFNEHGLEYVSPIVSAKLDDIDSRSVEDIMIYAGMKEGHLEESIRDMYSKLVSSNSEKMLAHIDIATVITDKINAMDERELERLILLVMKKELRTIVSLGGLIGFILGLLNCIS